jgi:hypothetical protein
MKILDYLKLRAKLEGVEHDLTQEFFDSHLRGGFRRFYGVIVDSKGIVLEDQENQSTELMQHWKNKL